MLDKHFVLKKDQENVPNNDRVAKEIIVTIIYIYYTHIIFIYFLDS